MANAKRRADWQRTSSVEAMYINMHRTKSSSKKIHPDELNPYIRKKKTQITGQLAWSMLEQAVKSGGFGTK